MAGKGMGCATRGGGAVMSGAKNHMVSEDSKKNWPRDDEQGRHGQ